MILIAGTVPDERLTLVLGRATRAENTIKVGDYTFPCTQCTGAMLSAALVVGSALGLEPPHALLAGDIGQGQGTLALYKYLTEHVEELKPRLLALHYCRPVVVLMQELYKAISKCRPRPFLIADAGSMYAAKASGLAPQFDIFTPDPGEMAFLADPFAAHPAYVRYELYDLKAERVPELAQKAYDHGTAAKILLVKGATDFVITQGKVISKVEEPNVPELECIGGTGDTITGMLVAFIAAGWDALVAAVITARINRLAGKMARATPATPVAELIEHIPGALRELGLLPSKVTSPS